MASCSSPTSGGNPGGGTGGGRAQVSGKIGKYGAPYVVGDIVFNDGSATPYAEIDDRTTNPQITTEEKAAAIAVIFYVGTGLNSDDVNGTPDNTTVRTLGVGLKHDNTGLAWCASTSVDGYSIDITTIQCTKTSGDKNGSDNYEQMAEFAGITDTTTLSNYPAFQFGKEYSTAATTRFTTTIPCVRCGLSTSETQCSGFNYLFSLFQNVAQRCFETAIFEKVFAKAKAFFYGRFL